MRFQSVNVFSADMLRGVPDNREIKHPACLENISSVSLTLP
jgi:hypothetical protein